MASASFPGAGGESGGNITATNSQLPSISTAGGSGGVDGNNAAFGDNGGKVTLTQSSFSGSIGMSGGFGNAGNGSPGMPYDFRTDGTYATTNPFFSNRGYGTASSGAPTTNILKP